MKCSTSLKLYFMDSHVEWLHENFGVYSKEHGEKFQQDIKGAYPPENRFFAFSGRETTQNDVLKILLRNSKNWLSYS